MFLIFKSEVESTQVANGGSVDKVKSSLNHPPILADLI